MYPVYIQVAMIDLGVLRIPGQRDLCPSVI